MKWRIRRLVLLGALLIAAMGAGQASVEDLPLNCIHPVYIITDDFNRDGKLDLSVACHSCNRVVVVENQWAPGRDCSVFLKPQLNAFDWLLGDAPLALATGYFLDATGPTGASLIIQDVFPHIVAATQFTPGIVRITPLKPTTAWKSWEFAAGSATVTRLVPTNGYPAHVVLADFNVDGRPDIAIADQLAGKVDLYYSPGSALPSLFGAGSSVRVPVLTATSSLPAPNARVLAAADFNRDGMPDLAVADGGGVTFFCNSASTPWGAPILTMIVGATTSSLAVGDLDRDGDVDVVAADPQLGAINILWNQGCWKFNLTRVKADGAYFAHIFDCNRDGVLDIAVAQKDIDTVSIFTGVLEGNTAANSDTDVCPMCSSNSDAVTYQLCTTHTLPSGSKPVGLASGDFDLNGLPDLAVANNGFPTGGTAPVRVIYNPCCCQVCNDCLQGAQPAPCGQCGSPETCDEVGAPPPPKL